jgi:hypothetical protein
MDILRGVGLFEPLTLRCPAPLRTGPDSCPGVRRRAAHPALALPRRLKGATSSRLSDLRPSEAMSVRCPASRRHPRPVRIAYLPRPARRLRGVTLSLSRTPSVATASLRSPAPLADRPEPSRPGRSPQCCSPLWQGYATSRPPTFFQISRHVGCRRNKWWDIASVMPVVRLRLFLLFYIRLVWPFSLPSFQASIGHHRQRASGRSRSCSLK